MSRGGSTESEREKIVGEIAWRIDKYCTGGDEHDWECAEAIYDAVFLPAPDTQEGPDSDSGEVVVLLGEREVSCIRFAASVVAGVEKELFDNGPHTGVREGEATSDILAALASRGEAALAATEGGEDG
jgi:hypothetical protein